MGRKEDVEVAAAFELFKAEDEADRATRCKYCGHVKAKNTIRQRQHLTECSEYLSAGMEAAASNDTTPQADPEPKAQTTPRTEQKNESPVLGFRRRRGRPSKGDKVALYACHSLDDLQTHLKQVLDLNASFIPTLLEATFVLQSETRFRITREIKRTVPEQTKSSEPSLDERDVEPIRPRTEDVQMDAWQVLDTQDVNEKLQLQRAVARVVIGVVKEVDGFGYGPGNHWTSADDGHRFQFLCYDSTQNSNRGRRLYTNRAQKTAEHSGDESALAGERAALPSFDCRGAISVKFCRTASRIEVVYSHARIHRTLGLRKAFRAEPRKRVLRTVSSIQQGTQQTPLSNHTSPGLPAGGAVLDTLTISQPEHRVLDPPNGSNNNGGTANGYDPSAERTSLQSAQHQHFESSVRSPEEVQTNNEFQGSASLINDSSDQPNVLEHGLGISTTRQVDRPADPKPQSTEGKARKHPPGLKRSRAGCYTCRQRRTKCDETHPICINCHKGGRECSYTDPAVSTYTGRWVEPYEIPFQNVEGGSNSTNQSNQPSQSVHTGNGWQYMAANTEGQAETSVKDPQAQNPSENQLSEASVAERLLRLLTQSNNT
ncbi:MAG: hypothetical protein M1812_003435 [Candelaria pacifica]|nr:MAG: hypothetical protein M1812_003435 [Candelaria pacifica]